MKEKKIKIRMKERNAKVPTLYTRKTRLKISHNRPLVLYPTCALLTIQRYTKDEDSLGLPCND